MIALLTGRIALMEADRCIVDVGGVGYLVHASTRTLSALPAPPEVARLLVETHVREDAILLYGFFDSAERDWFRLLTTVQGVGAKVALGVLSAMAPRDLVAAIAAGDKGSLTRAPGVGPKLAVRLLSELRDKVGAMPGGDGVALPVVALPGGGLAADALSALANLGYRRAEAEPVVARAVERAGDDATLDAVLRAALKDLAR
ncbi:MAG TPA: Holliday junction branch migration protein RuvA [Acetobacteraceae bacterium]|nr:Holliday junction branch migration protein RuvA [Acetobacteraceae bacterium]